MTRARHVVVTGAGGYIGRHLLAAMLADARFEDARLTAVDLALSDAWNSRIRLIEGDFTDRDTLHKALDGGADVVIHLAGVLGGAAETDPASSRRVNLDGALDLMDAVRDDTDPPRFVFASTVAVFGAPLPELVDDATVPLPTMVYGAHKRMIEVAIEQYSARGWLDGVAIRLPGIVARPGADARLKSAFLNTIFHDFAAGCDIVLPVSADGTSWLVSVGACVAAILHAASLPAGSLGRRRAFTLPAQRVQMSALVDALRDRFPNSRSRVAFEPDPALQAAFASHPPLRTAIAEELGFRHDGDLSRLVARAVSDQ